MAHRGRPSGRRPARRVAPNASTRARPGRPSTSGSRGQRTPVCRGRRSHLTPSSTTIVGARLPVRVGRGAAASGAAQVERGGRQRRRAAHRRRSPEPGRGSPRRSPRPCPASRGCTRRAPARGASAAGRGPGRRSGPRQRARGGRRASRRSERESLRWTMHQPVEPDLLVERRKHLVHARRRVDRVARTPQVRGVEAEREARSAARRRRARSASISASSSIVVPMPNPPPEPFSSTIAMSPAAIGSSPSSARARAATMPAVSRSRPASTPSPRCDPMWTLTNEAPYARPTRSSLASTRPTARGTAASGPARLMRYGAWMAIGAMSACGERLAERGSSSGSVGRRRHDGRVVGEHLDRRGADLDRAVRGLDHARAEWQVHADPARPWGACAKRSGGRAARGP